MEQAPTGDKLILTVSPAWCVPARSLPHHPHEAQKSNHSFVMPLEFNNSVKWKTVRTINLMLLIGHLFFYLLDYKSVHVCTCSLFQPRTLNKNQHYHYIHGLLRNFCKTNPKLNNMFQFVSGWLTWHFRKYFICTAI